jgi:molybdate transport system substrate-binding protein
MTTLRLISSMATKPLLADLVALYKAQAPGIHIQVESVGGVDAAKRVQAGEAFDGVVLASDAIDKLVASGHVRAGSRADLVRSGVAVAVPAGQPVPDISTESALKAAVLAAPTLGYSRPGASPRPSRRALCRPNPACLWARWWHGATWHWAFSS